jgi:hypothetical protein
MVYERERASRCFQPSSSANITARLKGRRAIFVDL